jgi:molybdopterin converting factor small subunit
MRVHIPSPLYSYTAGVSHVDAVGATLDQLLVSLDQRYPGLRFRIIDEQRHVRRHMRIFVNGEETEDLSRPLDERDAVNIVAALSGG